LYLGNTTRQQSGDYSVSNDPYAAPTANLDTSSAPVQTSLWSAKGRLGVLAYFAQSLVFTILAMIILFAALAIVGAVTGGGLDGMASMMEGGNSGPMGIAMLVVGLPIFLVILYVGVCFAIKRLHDRGHSGWWCLLLLVPIVSLLLYLYLLVPGKKVSNAYGAPRPTKGWEKVVGIISIIIMVGSILFGVFGMVAGMSGL